MNKWTIGTLAVVATVVMYVVGSYNGLVSSNEQVDAQWAQVETAYQRRADLIPNVVSTVKGYAGHENQTLVAVTEARAKVGQMKIDASQLTPANLQKLQAFEKAQGELSSALSRLMVVVEKYPDLKASSLFQDLAVQLEGTENRITVERKRYNDSARTQNVKIKSFPTSIIANAFGFEEKIYFKAEEGSQKAPKVDFGVTK